ncbi:hypothetical protein AWN76_001995 [Rhodothermaceae bacterium RA]|nr:hypothetical protein AWN76_001995 [Rhodothermaceae bacterium RA]
MASFSALPTPHPVPRCCALLLAGLLISSAAAQTVPTLGTEHTLDVATWNIEWFGDPSNGPSDDAQQFERVKAVIQQSGIDLWAVQEIADADDFDRLLDELGSDFAGVLATNSGQQRIGFIYDTRTVQLNGSPQHILESFDYDFAGRPPLQISTRITLPDTTVTVLFITVHMKAFSDRTSYERRQSASSRLKNRLDFLHPADRVVVLGDFNDELGRSTYLGLPSPYQNFLDDPDDYYFASLPLDAQDLGTYCSSDACSGSTLDHILITDEMLPPLVDGAADRFVALTSVFSAYSSTTSDHLPVYARFDFTRSTPLTPPPGVPARAALAAYPNPFTDALTIEVAPGRPEAVRVAVYDLLGRAVWQDAWAATPEPTRTVTIPTGTWAPGVYVVRVTSGTDVHSRLVTRVR